MPDKMEYSSNAVSHDAGTPQWNKRQLQMATNADYNADIFIHGTEFNADPKNVPY